MTKPLVSVCIPTYEYGRFLARAVDSVLAQTYENIELHVIDDVSHDETAEVMARYADAPQVTFHVNDENVGLFANFNRCFEVARGDYVKVLCADDWLDERCIEDSVATFGQGERIGMVTSPGWHVDVDGEVIGAVRAPFGHERVVPGRRALEAHADWGNTGGMPSHVLLPREVIEEVGGFEEEFAPASDLHLWLKILASYDLGWVPEPRCFLRLHGEHAHTYGSDPTEAIFLSWEDMARREPEAVGSALLKRAVYREARHCLLYVVSHGLRFGFGRAARIVRFMRPHVRWRSVLPRFLLDVPGIVREQTARAFARATGRLVLYEPAPRAGPRITAGA